MSVSTSIYPDITSFSTLFFFLHLLRFFSVKGDQHQFVADADKFERQKDTVRELHLILNSGINSFYNGVVNLFGRLMILICSTVVRLNFGWQHWVSETVPYKRLRELLNFYQLIELIILRAYTFLSSTTDRVLKQLETCALTEFNFLFWSYIYKLLIRSLQFRLTKL